MSGSAADQVGTPRWIQAFVFLLFVVLSVYYHGWSGLPPEVSPGGFRAPMILAGFLALLVMEGDRLVRSRVDQRGGHAGQIVFLIGLALFTNWNDVLFIVGPVIVLISGAIKPLYNRFAVLRAKVVSNGNPS